MGFFLHIVWALLNFSFKSHFILVNQFCTTVLNINTRNSDIWCNTSTLDRLYKISFFSTIYKPIWFNSWHFYILLTQSQNSLTSVLGLLSLVKTLLLYAYVSLASFMTSIFNSCQQTYLQSYMYMNWQLLLLEISLYFTSFSLETFLEEFISFVVSLLGGLNQPGHCYFPVLLAILICPGVCQFKVVFPQQNLAFFITIRSHLLPLLEIICINNKKEICIVMNILVEKKWKL